MDTKHALEVADALHTIGAGTPEYAVDQVIGEGADIIRELVENTKVYIVLWSATYEDTGHHSVHRTREGADAEAERMNALEAEQQKAHKRLSRNWYEVEELELQP